MHENKPTRIIIGNQFHEIFKICAQQELDPFEFISGYLNIILSDLPEIQFSALKNLGHSVNYLNKYFKDFVIHELWDSEKFSLKEAQNEPDVEKYTLQLWDVTHGILALENQIVGNITRYWREMTTLYENIILMIDGQAQKSEEERPNTASIEGRE